MCEINSLIKKSVYLEFYVFKSGGFWYNGSLHLMHSHSFIVDQWLKYDAE